MTLARIASPAQVTVEDFAGLFTLALVAAGLASVWQHRDGYYLTSWSTDPAAPKRPGRHLSAQSAFESLAAGDPPATSTA